jgi:hypothetical protein
LSALGRIGGEVSRQRWWKRAGERGTSPAERRPDSVLDDDGKPMKNWWVFLFY